ncbi:MAG: putative ATPase with chaperone activity [Porticoccus sp.]|jgi:predicted ATPase with chaperone activity
MALAIIHTRAKRDLVVPMDNADETALANNTAAYPANHLLTVYADLNELVGQHHANMH